VRRQNACSEQAAPPTPDPSPPLAEFTLGLAEGKTRGLAGGGERGLLGTPYAGLPLVICGVLKVAYDAALLLSFRHIKPPEEA